MRERREKVVKTNAKGFGMQLERFTLSGLHPCLNRNGECILGPGHYDAKVIGCPYKDHLAVVDGSPQQQKQPWRRALESLEYSRHMGFRNGELLAERQFMRGLLGPGSHDIDPTKLYGRQAPSPCENLNFGRESREKGDEKERSPGPARYAIKMRCWKTPHLGTTWTRTRRWKDDANPWQIPCNRYKIRDPKSMDAYVTRLVSRRGPYDCFTGPRDETNLFNKLAKGKPSAPDKMYTWPSDLDQLLGHTYNARKGKFLCAERFPSHPTGRNMLTDPSLCYRRPKDPGPAHYILKPVGIVARKEQKYPFGFSGLHVRGKLDNESWVRPGPGRYNNKPIRCTAAYRKAATSVFVSKTGRTEYKVPEYNAF